jgi:hypothetical protein
MKTVILTVEGVESRALVIVYPFAINNIKRRNAISPEPVKSPPNTVKGPKPETAYFAHVTAFIITPDQWKITLNVKRR